VRRSHALPRLDGRVAEIASADSAFAFRVLFYTLAMGMKVGFPDVEPTGISNRGLIVRMQGLSTQIVECVRIARMIGKHGESFLNRVYSEEEIQLCKSSKHSTQMFSAYWACKEAILKLLGIEDRKRFDWREVEITWRNERAFVTLKGSLGELKKLKQIREIWVSYSYTRNYAFATVMAFDES
jgi:holo-[acyl-carrier protein] synthase